MLLEARVNQQEALRYLGYAGQAMDEDLSVRFQRAVGLCSKIPAQGMSHTFPIESFEFDECGTACAVHLVGTSFVLEGRDISAHVAGAREVALMVATLGLESEALLHREAAISPLDGLLVDACASSLVEEAANALSALVTRHAAGRGLRAGRRFSPGYGDFPLSAQGAFLAAVGADKALGISATSADLLVPSKSITAVCGLCESVPADPEASPSDAAATRQDAYNADVEASATTERNCKTCNLWGSCLLRAQGRTCYGR